MRRTKRFKRSKLTTNTIGFNLDDLHDSILVEILRRLPWKSAVQCMCVCKRWCSLVSNNPCFDDRFLRVQIDKQVSVSRSSLIFTNPRNRRDFFTTSEHPWAPKRVLRGDRLQRNFSLRFLPCFKRPVKTIAEGGEPIVVAAHNGLLFCPVTRWVQQDYYICYPYTKPWDALPRPPQCTNKVIVGLIMCNPYNNLGDRRVCEDQYRYRVVRIIIPDDDRDERYNSSIGQFKAEIFAAETRKWTERVVLYPKKHKILCW